MRPSAASALATLASTAAAASPRPFLLLSTHKSSELPSVPQYAADSLVLDAVKPYLSGCPTEKYLIVNQADLHSTDIYDLDTVPNLRRHIQNERWQDRIEVGEVHDKVVDNEALAAHIVSSCPNASVDSLYLRSLGKGDGRREILADNDLTLSDSINAFESVDSITFIYLGGPIDADAEAAASKDQYVAQFPDDGAHFELKRQLASRNTPSTADDDDESWPTPPDRKDWTWFQKNSWISQAQIIIIVTVVVFVILMLWAMQQVTSIVIPYGSFDAEFVQAATSGEKKKNH